MTPALSSANLFSHVLLIEDDPSHAVLIKRALKDFVGGVEHATQLAAGMDLLERGKHDLVITDLHLPDTSGTSGAHKLDHVRKLFATTPAPIIVLTSSTSLDDAVEAMRIGARDFIVKNFDGDFKAALGMSLSRLTAALLIEQERLRLQQEMAALRVAIDSSKDGFAIIDDSGTITYRNRFFDNIFADCGGAGNSIYSIFSPRIEKHENVRNAFERNAKQVSVGSVFHTEIALKEAKGVAFDLSVSGIAASSDKHARAAQSVVWLKDISEQKRREKFQREILSTTTHDLKGPLGAIIISSELLRDTLQQTDQKREYELALRIASSAQGAVNLIDEFLSARRIQEGNFVLRPAPHDVAALAEEVVSANMPVAAARKISLKFEPPAADCSLSVDKMGFIRVLSNLLSNALKFTPKEGKVTVRLLPEDGEMHLLVSDTGSGMEPAEVQKIFERFSRLTKHQEVAGTGIGLFVVKSIVSAHGGRIDVVSQPGVGTTFDIAFPKHPPVNERGELYSLDFN